jgi:hypothetical protein
LLAVNTLLFVRLKDDFDFAAMQAVLYYSRAAATAAKKFVAMRK